MQKLGGRMELALVELGLDRREVMIMTMRCHIY